MAAIHPFFSLTARRWAGHPNGIGAPFVFGRNSAAASYTNARGQLGAAGLNVLRHEWQPKTMGYRGLLIMPARTNLFLHSNDFTQAAWGKENSSISAGASTGPDGTASLSKIIEDSSASTYHRVVQSVSVTNGTRYAISFFARRSGSNRDYIRVETSGGLPGSASYFNLNTGAVGTLGHLSSAIEDWGDGLYRCIVISQASSSASAGVYIYFAPSETNSWSGDGTSGGFLGQMQIEAGSYASRQIATAGATVTQNADALTFPLSALPATMPFDATAFTFLVEFSVLAAGVQREIFRVYDGASGGVTLYTSSGDALLWNFGGQQASISSAITANTTIRISGTCTATGAKLCLNGATPVAKTDSSVPTGLTTLALSGAPGGGLDYLGGHYRQFRLFSGAASDAELQRLAAQ